MSWATGWGSWHSSDVIPQACPQGDGPHTIEKAVALNDENRAELTAKLRENEKRWLSEGSGTLASS